MPTTCARIAGCVQVPRGRGVDTPQWNSLGCVDLNACSQDYLGSVVLAARLVSHMHSMVVEVGICLHSQPSIHP